MIDIFTRLTEVQHRADTLQSAQEALADGTKVLADNIVEALVKCTEPFTSEHAQSMVHGYAQHHFQVNKLKGHGIEHAAQLNALQRDLDTLRKYLGFQTADSLREAVEAGITKPIPAPVAKPIHIDVSQAKRAADKARAEEVEARAEKARAAAAEAAQEKTEGK